MSGLAQLLHRERFGLIRSRVIVAALALAVAGALAAGAHWSAGQARVAHEAAVADREAQRAELESLRTAAAELERNLEPFRQLHAGGFIGEGDRLAWTEGLMAVKQAMALPNLWFELGEPLPLQPSEAALDPELAALSEPRLEGPLAHDMQIMLTGVHEGELLELLQRLRALDIGWFRVERCAMARAVEGRPGLDVDCTLRWITYQPRQPATGDDGSGA